MANNSLPPLKPLLLNLREAKGSNLKLKILKEITDEYPSLLEVFRYCFDYSKAWGIADKTLGKVEKIAKLEEFFQQKTSIADALDSFLDLCKQDKISQNELIDFAKKVTEDDWYFYKHIFSKDLKSGVGIGLIKRIVPNIKQFLTQAANKNLDVLDFNKEYIVEPKLDGVRCVAIIHKNNVKLYSRNGKQITNFVEIEKELLELYALEAKNGIVIDGELLTNKNNFRQLMQTLYSLEPKRSIVDSTKYNSFDCLSLTDFESQTNLTPLRERKKSLRAGTNWVTVVESKSVKSREDIERAFVSYVNEGYEGIMVKDLDSNYAFKRNDNWLKLKPSDEYTFIIVGFKEGTGKYAGKLGSFCGEYIENPDITVDCGSGLSDEERVEYWEKREELLGTKFDIASDGILETGSLRFPIFVRLREDL